MPRVLDNRENHLLLLKDDGTTDLVPKTDRNRLLWEYDLFPVLRDREESLHITGEDDYVHVMPSEAHDGDSFRIVTSEYDYVVPPNKLDFLVELLIRAYEETPGDEPDPAPIATELRVLLDTDVGPDVVDEFAQLPTFRGRVEVRSDGWLIHDHLLLTYDNEFFNIRTESKQRQGGEAVPTGSKQEAYRVRTPRHRNFEGVLDGTLRPEDAEFVVRALWAIDHTQPE